MSGPNKHWVKLIIGKREVGKTPYYMGDEGLGIKGLIDEALEKGQKSLTVDMRYHSSYDGMLEIKKEDLEYWHKGPFKLVEKEKSGIREAQKLIRLHVTNCLIGFEDAFRYERIKLTDEVLAIIGDANDNHNDIAFMYHDWSFVPQDLYIYTDEIEVFKTASEPDKRESKNLGSHFSAVLETCRRVNNHKNWYHHESINVKQ